MNTTSQNDSTLSLQGRVRRGSGSFSARARQLASIHKDIDRMVDLEFEMAIDEMECEADE